jgi:hypothetical protein
VSFPSLPFASSPLRPVIGLGVVSKLTVIYMIHDLASLSQNNNAHIIYRLELLSDKKYHSSSDHRMSLKEVCLFPMMLRYYFL